MREFEDMIYYKKYKDEQELMKLENIVADLRK